MQIDKKNHILQLILILLSHDLNLRFNYEDIQLKIYLFIIKS